MPDDQKQLGEWRDTDNTPLLIRKKAERYVKANYEKGRAAAKAKGYLDDLVEAVAEHNATCEDRESRIVAIPVEVPHEDGPQLKELRFPTTTKVSIQAPKRHVDDPGDEELEAAAEDANNR